MNCPKCGKALQPGATFCMHCGQMLAAAPAGVGGHAAMHQSFVPVGNRNRTTILAILAAMAILLALILGLQAAGVLHLGGSLPKVTALNAQGQAPDATLHVQGQQGAPSLNAVAPKPLEMPQDVFDWLEHLRKTEDKKNELYLRQTVEMKKFQQEIGVLGPAIGEMDPYDQSGDPGKEPAGVVHGKFGDLRPDWRNLVDFFHSKPPPEECVPIANDYSRAVTEIPGMIGDLMDVLNMASSDPQKALEAASKMKNKSYGDIDRYLISTDERVKQICDKYHRKKWFNIKTDVDGTGSLFKMGF